MTLQELLNADVSSIGQWARQGFAWWIDELSTLLPANWRNWFSVPGAAAGRAGAARRLATVAERQAPYAGPGPAARRERRRGSDPSRGRRPAAPARVPARAAVGRQAHGRARHRPALAAGRRPRLSRRRNRRARRRRRQAGGDAGRDAAGRPPCAISPRRAPPVSNRWRSGPPRGDGGAGYRFDFLPALKASMGESDGGRVVAVLVERPSRFCSC